MHSVEQAAKRRMIRNITNIEELDAYEAALKGGVAQRTPFDGEIAALTERRRELEARSGKGRGRA